MKLARLFTLLPALLLTSSLLHAHTALDKATPKDGAVLTQAPATLDLAFTEEVQLLKFALTDAEGEAVATDFKASAAASKTFSLPLPAALPAKAYKANWTVLGKDGHQVQGSLGFTVDHAGTEPAEADAASAAAQSHNDHH